MTPDRHERITEIFNAAAELSPADRRAFLEAKCGSDAGLREEVESLLAHDSPGSSPLDAPIFGTGFNVTSVVPTDNAIEEALPAQIGPYRILGVLGTGSMGVVYRAQQNSPPRVVALKVMYPGRISRSMKRRFRDEITSLARLRHPGIAQIHDAGAEETSRGARPYLAMELIDGRPLLDYVRERQLDSRARLELLVKICDAVQHAHQHGVIHRDLKPTNILVEDSDSGPRPCILDFGVARLTDRDVRAATLATEQGQLVGTLAYMSPEQVSADAAGIDTRSDVYALGVIGYELLCETLPIDVRQMSVFAALQAIKEKSPPAAAVHNRQFRGDLSTILDKALAKDKHRRYESASALATDIRNYLAHRPILARPPNLTYAVRKFIRRNRLVTAVFLLGGGVAAYGLVRAQLATRELRAQYRETRDIATFLVGDFVNNLDTIGGTAELRGDLLRRLQTHIQSLIARNPGDAPLHRAQADVLDRLSDIDLAEGRCDAARELRERALTIRQRVVAALPDDPDRQADLSISLVKVGDIFRQRNELQHVEGWYRQALAIDERLVGEHPENRRFLDNLAHSYARVGWLAKNTGRSPEAEDLYTRSLATYARLVELYPAQLITLYGCWEIEGLLCEMAADQDRVSVAGAHARSALDCTIRLVAQAPDNRVYLAAYAHARRSLAGYVAGNGQVQEAQRHLEEAQRVDERLCALDPQDVGSQRELCDVLVARIPLLIREDRAADAYTCSVRAVSIARSLLIAEPAPSEHMRRLAQALSRATRVALALGWSEEATSSAREELEWRRKLVQREAPDIADLRVYAELLLQPALPEQADPQRACDAARRAVELSGGTVARNWHTLGRCYRALKDVARAQQCFQHALAVLPEDASSLRTALCRQLDAIEAELADR